MPALPLLRRRRKRRTFEHNRTQGRLTRGVIAVGLTLAMLMAVVIIGGAFAYASITVDLPSLDLLPALLDPINGSLLQPTRIYDRTGTHLLTTLAPQDAPRKYVPLDPKRPDHLPDSLARATVALLDPGFWSHRGTRLKSLLNADEHPTLAQKLVSDLLLWNEPAGLRRAIREQILATQLTARFGRQQILEWYLNSANYGHFAYGAEAAASLYLGKPVASLNLAEAALLASVNQSPAINPLDAPQAALQSQQEAINLIKSRGLATAAETDQARNTRLNFLQAVQTPNAAPAFTALALSQLETRFNRARVEQGGLQVLTTLDYDLQISASCDIQTQFALMNNTGTQVIQPCAGAETLPVLSSDQSAGQSASAVVLDPHNGQILALIGDSKKGSASVYLTPHRPGNLLIPFVYLAGFTRGLSPATLLWDLPPENSDLSNSEQRTYLGPVRLRAALANDSLVTAAQVFNQMGAGLVQQTMAPFGFDIPADNLKTLIETENRYSVIQIAQSYGVLAALGSFSGQASPEGQSASAILAVRGLDGQDYADWSNITTEQIVSPQLAYLLTDVLNANFQDGADTRAGSGLGRPAALKTGLTPDGSETWVVGYTPHRVVVVWMGADLPGKPVVSQRPAAGLWSAIMQTASREVPPDNWAMPPGMLRLKVCDPSGMLPSDSCPNVVDEIFIDGYQPLQTDTLYQSYEINRETGLLATVFTPEQLVEKRVFMRVPPEAQAWAKSANLPLPPSQYDNIQPPAPNPDVNIAFPRMFTKLQGRFNITGTAGGVDFSYYRLQYGQGLNPETWIQIGSDVNTPLKNGKLAEWDTTGLKGLYSLQLLVIRSDHSLQTATVQVSLDNP
jgi:membrane carboxypeptidase/penicillin-binding protein